MFPYPQKIEICPAPKRKSVTTSRRRPAKVNSA
jgi:hypothetical protein